MSELLTYALSYARRGWQVFPLIPGDKKPAVKGWPDKATTDEDQIRKWFTGTRHGVGIATGPASGLFVVDVDLKNGHRGDLSLDAMCEALGDLPDTLTQVTASGGKHLLFRYPPGRSLRNKADLYDGIDTRGAGGYIVAAPTTLKDGTCYGWDGVDDPKDVEAVELADLPEAWVRLFEQRIEPKSKQGKAVARSLKAGGRNDTLTRHAGWLRRQGHTREAISAALMAINAESCDPPLPAAEVRAIAKSVERYEPGDLPEESAKDQLMCWADRMLTEPSAEVMMDFAKVAPAASQLAAEEPAWWVSFTDLLLSRGAGRSAVSAVKKQVRPKRQKATQDNTGQRLSEDFEAAGLPPGLSIAPPYTVRADAVIQVTESEEEPDILIAPAPVFLDARYRDEDTDRESVRLVWLRDGKWVRRILPRGSVAQSRELAAQAEFGLPVTSLTAGRLAQYLAALEAENLELLRPTSVTERCGWHGDAFVLPSRTIGSDSPTWNVNDDGLRQIGRSVDAAGDYEAWRSLAQRCAEHPWVRLALAAALCAPYLEMVGAANFLLDLGGRTSSGKTTTLRLAASCWGCPDEAEGRSYLRSWSATRTAIERMAATLSGLPTILDETKRASGPGDPLGSIAYDLASGQGRGRGTATGMQRTTATRTVVLTSGEQPLLELTTHQGLVGRVIQITGSPFGADNQRVLAETIREVTDQHYGHAGPRVIDALVRDRPLRLIEAVRSTRRYLAEGVTSRDPLVGRLCAHYAVLAVCGQHAFDTLGIEADVPEAVEMHLAVTDRAMGGRDQARLALELVMDLEVTQPDAIDDGNDRRSPPGGFLGVRAGDRSIYWHPEPLRRYLESSGFRAGEVMTIWLERGWIEGEGTRTTKKVRLHNGLRPRVVVMTPAAREAIGVTEQPAHYEDYPC